MGLKKNHSILQKHNNSASASFINFFQSLCCFQCFLQLGHFLNRCGIEYVFESFPKDDYNFYFRTITIIQCVKLKCHQCRYSDYSCSCSVYIWSVLPSNLIPKIVYLALVMKNATLCYNANFLLSSDLGQTDVEGRIDRNYRHCSASFF